MATYLILNLAVLLAVWILIGQMPAKPSRAWVFTLAFMLVLTLIFDNLLIWLDMFSYAEDKILNIRVSLAPIEDFIYPLLATILIPAVWNKLGKQYD